MSLNYIKSIRDPLYGYIHLTLPELDLLSHPLIQRLRYIKQLSFADLIYPDAMPTRFSRALGTMHIAGRMIEF